MQFMDFCRTGIRLDMRPTQIQVKVPCVINGIQRKVGDIVTVGRVDANDLSKLRRAIIVR